MRACFQIFGHLYMVLGPKPLTHSFESVFLKTRPKSASIEALIGLPAYL